MREFLRYLFVVAAMLMVVVGDVWGECYALNESAEQVYRKGGSHTYSLNGFSGATLTFTAKKETAGGGVLRLDQKIDDSWVENTKSFSCSFFFCGTLAPNAPFV